MPSTLSTSGSRTVKSPKLLHVWRDGRHTFVAGKLPEKVSSRTRDVRVLDLIASLCVYCGERANPIEMKFATLVTSVPSRGMAWRFCRALMVGFWSALKAIPSWMWRNSPTSSVLQGSGPLTSPGSLSPVDRKACERFLRVRSPGSRNTIRPQRNRCWSPWMNTAAVPQDTEFSKCVRELFARGATSLPQAALSQRVIYSVACKLWKSFCFPGTSQRPKGIVDGTGIAQCPRWSFICS